MKRKIRKSIFVLFVLGLCIGKPVILTEAAQNGSADSIQEETLEQENCAQVESSCEKGGLRKGELVWDPNIEVTIYRRVDNSATEQNYWKKFESNYYYNQLPSNQKEIWDGLEERCIGVVTGTEDTDAVAVQFDNSAANMSKEEIANLLYLFKLSNPQYYFLDSKMGWSQNGNQIAAAIYLYEAFADGTDREKATNEFCEQVDTWVEQIAAMEREEEKVKLAHDIVASNTIYSAGTYDQSAYSMVCQGQTVCAGYSAVLQMLLNANSIETIEVTSEYHAWNDVFIHNQWYAVDVTYDDQSVIFYDYYVKSNATIQVNNSDHIPEAMWEGYLPELKYDATLSSNKTYLSPYFTEGDYVYFKVNDNVKLAERYAVAVEAVNGVNLSDAPDKVVYAGNTYQVLAYTPQEEQKPSDNQNENPNENQTGNPDENQTGNPDENQTGNPDENQNENQDVDIQKTGVCQGQDGNWYYYENGSVNYGYTGLASSESGWWYVENGMVNFNYNGLVPYGDCWWCVAGGTIAFDYTGLWYDQNAGWWYVENGAINFSYNGLVPLGDVWWCVAGGRVAFEYTGLWYDQKVGWWYVENGAINFGCNVLIPYGDAWWCVAGGRVAFEYTGLWYDQKVGWWYVENGTINFCYNGLIPLGDAWWCVAGGRVAFEYTGLWYDPYVGWWYVENGMLHFGYTGNVFWNGSSYHVVNGQVV